MKTTIQDTKTIIQLLSQLHKTIGTPLQEIKLYETAEQQGFTKEDIKQILDFLIEYDLVDNSEQGQIELLFEEGEDDEELEEVDEMQELHDKIDEIDKKLTVIQQSMNQ